MLTRLAALSERCKARIGSVPKPRQLRVRTPTILQMEAAECGAASLAIVLAWLGRFVPLEELRLACGVSRDGSKASNVIRAGRSYGLLAQGKRLEIEALHLHSLPFIVFWNFNHFLVVEGFGKDRVYLNDPACGPRVVTTQEFHVAYTGVMLSFEAGPEFRKGGQPRALLTSLKERLHQSHTNLLFVLLASLALVIPGLIIPIFTQVFVDDYLIAGMDSSIKPLLLGMALTAVLRAAITWLQQTQLLRLEMQLALSSAGNFFWHVLRLPMGFFQQRYAGDISQRVGNNDRIASLLSGEIATNAVNIVALVFYVAIMLQYDWVLTMLGLAIVSFNLVLLKAIARRRRDGSMRLQLDQGKLMATVMGGIQTIETIKATGSERDFFMRWSGYKAKVNNTEQQMEVYTRLLASLPNFLNALVTVAILGLGGARVMSGELTIGMLVAYQSLMASFTQPITNLMGLAATLQEADADLAGLDDVLHQPVEARFGTPAAAGAAAPRGGLQGYLELRDLCFGYSRLDPPLIEGFNLRLAPGQRVALVGASGSGKSTIAKLVMGLIQPWSGQVLLDDMPQESLAAEMVRATLAGVDQEIYLFEGTVRENLTLWDPTLAEADLLRAAQDACIHDLIASRPGGYDGPIGEGGADLSGGQAQRMEIARALAGNPRILVLDEATSALDPGTEREIDDQLRRRGCACLIVAHRLSTIRDCDEIIVMERGKIIERGSHAVLLAQGGAYSRMIGAE